MVLAQPFLKWAGGKRQLLPQLRRFYPDRITHYFEPFLGSGAVFFDLWRAGRFDGARATLTDDNADLIGTYLRVADSVECVIGALEHLAHDHRLRGRDHFYDVRDRRFNPARAEWMAAGGRAADYPVALAAMLIYLNRTAYNGLFRLNATGGFNVPAGRYMSPTILDAERLRVVSRVLADERITVAEASFLDATGDATRGDVVYLDPPYAPLSSTANFRSYTARGFGPGEQRQLRDAVLDLVDRGVSVLLSNSTAPLVLRLYENNLRARRLGLRCWRIPARRSINSRGDRRGVVDELLVSNIAPQEFDRRCAP